eukprot:COSAG04_NODE_245_length_18929_cov_6.708391_4_plen_3740_part_00
MLSAWRDRDTELLANASSVAHVHYDTGYTHLRWNVTAAPLAVPGTVRVSVTPVDATSAALARDTHHVWWFRYRFAGYGSGMRPTFVEDPSIELRLPPPNMDLSLSEPGIYYVGIFGSFSTGGFVSHRAPIPQSDGFQPHALVIPYGAHHQRPPSRLQHWLTSILCAENGTTAALPKHFHGGSLTLPPIPGDLRLALMPAGVEKTSITIFDGGTLSLRMEYPNNLGYPGSTIPKFAGEACEMELPKCATLLSSRSYAVAPVDGAPAGSHRLRITPKPPHNWESDNRVLQIWPKCTCDTPAHHAARLRVLRDVTAPSDGSWQELELKVVSPPVAPAVAPTRLAPSLTWANSNFFSPTDDDMAHSLHMFRATGLVVVPDLGAEHRDPYDPRSGFFSPAQREGPDWEGLQYGPQISSFYNSYKGPGMYTALAYSEAEQQAFAPKLISQYNLSSAEAEEEMKLWTNALAFRNKTKHIDPAYDGFFFQMDLDVVKEIVGVTQPDYWIVDSESFCPWDVWITAVADSANAEARRKPGESDAALAYRASAEFMDRYNATVAAASGGKTALGWFGGEAVNWQGVGTYPWPILQADGMLNQPSWYGPHSTANLAEFAAGVRAERLAMNQTGRMIPWVTVGTGGYTAPKACFDELLHLFLNGAVGFSYFAEFDFGDMQYWLEIAALMALLTPHEDVIADGVIAVDSLTISSNAVASAMHHGQRTLIGITPLDSTAALSVKFEAGGTQNVVHNLRTNATRKLSGGRVAIDGTYAESQVFLVVTEATTQTSRQAKSAGSIELKTDDESGGDETAAVGKGMALRVVTPGASADSPLRQMNFGVEIDEAPEDATWFRLDQTHGPAFSGLAGGFWFARDEQSGGATQVKWWSEYADRNDAAHDPIDPAHSSGSTAAATGKFTIELSAWKGREGQWLANATSPATIHYDKSYTALRWDITTAARGVPGAVRVSLTPANKLSETLAPQTGHAWWFRYKYSHTTSGKDPIAQFTEDVSIEKTLEPPHFDLSLSVPATYFLGIFGTFSKGASPGTDGTFAGGIVPDGFPSQRAPLAKVGALETFQPIAVTIPFANGTHAPLPPGFRGKHVVLPPIPGDCRLALQPTGDAPHTRVTMFDGGTLSLRLLYPDSKMLVSFIELEMPDCMSVGNMSQNYKYNVIPAPTQAVAQGGTSRVRLVPTMTGRWSSAQRVLQLWPHISCAVPSSVSVKIRALRSADDASGDGNWQRLAVELVAPPTPLAQPPKRLAPSLSWAPTEYFAPNATTAGVAHSIKMFRAVGMTTIPMLGAEYRDPHAAASPGAAPFYWSKAQRAASPMWQGLKYAPEISSFYHSFMGPGLFEVLSNTSATPPLQVLRDANLSDAAIASEMALLSHALDFYNATRRVDVGYNGFFFRNDLDVVRQIVAFAKPEFLFVDSEKFCPWAVWLVSVGLSANAAARRQPAESDAALAYRIANEFMSEYSATVVNASDGETQVGFFAAGAAQNKGVGSFPWTILKKLGQLSQPGYYGQRNTRNLPLTVAGIRAEKQALGVRGNRMIPWLTVDTEGPTTPSACFDELVHVFLNGASGFGYYSDIDFHDMLYFVKIAAVLKLLAPYEDLIIDGSLAHDAVSSSHNCIISAMRMGEVALLGVTAENASQPVSFDFHQVNGTGSYHLTDLATGKVVRSEESPRVSFEGTLKTTAVFRFAPPVRRVKTDESIRIDFGRPILVSKSRAAAVNSSTVRCWCDFCTTWDFPRLNFIGQFPYLQVQTCNDDDHVAWGYYGMTSSNGGAEWVSGASGLGPQQNGAELLVPLNESAGLGIPFQLFYRDEHTAIAPAKVLTMGSGGSVMSDGAFPTGKLVTFSGLPYALSNHRNTAGTGPGKVPWNTTNGLLTNGNAVAVGDKLLATLYFEPDLPSGTPLKGRVSAVLCFESEDRGWNWRFRSIVASNFGRPHPPYTPPSAGVPFPGPTESNLALLPDGTLLCVFRVRSPDNTYPGAKGPANGVLWRAISHNKGASWSTPRPAYSLQVATSPASPDYASDSLHPHSVQPKLAMLPNGVVLLSSGRYGTFVWASTNQSVDSASTAWIRGNVAANHNQHVAPEWHLPAHWVAGEWPAGGPGTGGSQPSTGYSGLIRWPGSKDTALLCYDRSHHYMGLLTSSSSGGTDSIWCVNVTATRTSVKVDDESNPAQSPVSISVIDHGADPTGVADSTEAFRSALAAAAAPGPGNASTGIPVVVPSGTYLVTGEVNVTDQTLMGAGPAAWVSDGSPQPKIVFRPFGSDPQGSAFVHLGAGGTVHGLHVDVDWDGHEIQAVPPTIDLRTGDGPRVTDMRISSAWDAISSLGNQNCGRYYVANIFIVDAHHYGVAMGASFDFSTMDNVEVWNPNSVLAFANGTGVLINGVDGLRASNIAVFRAATGVQVTDRVEGMPVHNAWVSFSNVLTDFCKVGMVINGSNVVQLSSGSFQSHETSLNIVGRGGTVRVAASRFKSNGDSAVRISASSIVTIAGSGMHRVFPSIPNVPALRIEAPAADDAKCNSDSEQTGCQESTVLISGCDMEASDKVVIDCAGEGVSKNAAPQMCANDSVMLTGNFLRPLRNDSLADAPPRRWGGPTIKADDERLDSLDGAQAHTAVCTNATDCTSDLQNAIINAHWPAGPGLLRVPALPNGADWIVRPIFLNRSNLVIVFARGATVMAMRNQFRGEGDCLFSAHGIRNVSLIGYGATWRMRKADYQNRTAGVAGYSKSEHRHGLQLHDTEDITIAGLTIRETGGDGLDMGSWGTGVKGTYRTHVRDCQFLSNHRQGMSVGHAVDLLVERTVFANTSGTAPEAGVDLEPDVRTEQLTNVSFVDCLATGNAGNQFSAWLAQLDASSEPVSVSFRNCTAVGRGAEGGEGGWHIGGVETGLRGSIEVFDSHVSSTYDSGAWLVDLLSPASFAIRFVNTVFDHVAMKQPAAAAHPITLQRENTGGNVSGGVSFEDCTLIDDEARHFMLLDGGTFDLMNVRYTGQVRTVAYRDCVAVIMARATENVVVNASCAAQGSRRPRKNDDFDDEAGFAAGPVATTSDSDSDSGMFVNAADFAAGLASLRKDMELQLQRLQARVEEQEITIAALSHNCTHSSAAPDELVELKRGANRNQRRRRAQATDACESGQEFQALADAAMAACCPAGSGGHRRFLQTSCELPDTCSSVACAAVFVPFMDDCGEMLARSSNVPLDQFQAFQASCQGMQAGAGQLLQPVNVQMFRVLVDTEGAAQAGAMFPRGNGDDSGNAPLQPLPPVPPPPAPSGSGGSGEATGVEQYHAECASADVATCVPACNAEHHGYELLATIDGTDTKFSCNVAHGLYSWVGAASEGGYLGADFASFFSAVASGAAGAYIVTLTEDAGISTELTIRPGQDVRISGDLGLSEAPSWGGGGFVVQERGSLSLTYSVVEGDLTVLGGGSLRLNGCTVHGALTVIDGSARLTGCTLPNGATVHATPSVSLRGLAMLSLTSMDMPVAALGKMLAQIGGASLRHDWANEARGGSLRFDRVTAREFPGAGEMTGIMTVARDGSKTTDPPEFGALPAPPSEASFVVNSGPCATMFGGRCVGRLGYLPGEECTITVARGGALLPCPVFDMDPREDGSYEDTVLNRYGDHIELPPHMELPGQTRVRSGSNCPVDDPQWCAARRVSSCRTASLSAGDTVMWRSNDAGQGNDGAWHGGGNDCQTKGTCGMPWTVENTEYWNPEGSGTWEPDCRNPVVVGPDIRAPDCNNGPGGGWLLCFAEL